MKLKADHIAFAIICALILGVFAFVMPKQKAGSTMTLTSRAFNATQSIPTVYTCDGKNMIPPLAFGRVPAGTKELVLTMFDPDAPKSGFSHWALYNINPQTGGIEEGSIPAGAKEALNDSGKPGYIGPCPPSGTHRYLFTLYAVGKNLSFPAAPDVATLKNALSGKVLGRATLTASYTKTSQP